MTPNPSRADWWKMAAVVAFSIVLSWCILRLPDHPPHATLDLPPLTNAPPTCTISEPYRWAMDTTATLHVLICKGVDAP